MIKSGLQIRIFRPVDSQSEKQTREPPAPLLKIN